MKKLLHTLFLFCTLFMGACETKNVSKIRAEVKVIGKCCKELAAGNHNASKAHKEENETAEPDKNVSSILPAYFWDTKSMIW